MYTADIVMPSIAASVCSDSSLLLCSCLQLTLTCQVLPHHCVTTPSSSQVLVYNMPSSTASECSDSSLLSYSCIQLTLSCQVAPDQCLLTPPSYPVLVYSWHCLATYCRISVFRLLPPPLFLYTAATVLPSTAAPVNSDYSLLPCSFIQLTLSCQVLQHQCVLTPPSSPVLVYSWYCLSKCCLISVFWLFPLVMSLYTADIVLSQTAAPVCIDSSLIPYSCIQLKLPWKEPPHQ